MTQEEYNKDVIERSQSEVYDYPDVFKEDCGIGIDAGDGYVSTRSWDYSERQSRKVTLKVTSYKGMSFGAIHIYGRLIVEGVLLKKDDVVSRRSPNFEHRRKNPLLGYTYELPLQRPVTQRDKDIDAEARSESEMKFEYNEVGDLTNRWNNIDEILTFAIIVFNTRFEGNWELWLDCDWNREPKKLI